MYRNEVRVVYWYSGDPLMNYGRHKASEDDCVKALSMHLQLLHLNSHLYLPLP